MWARRLATISSAATASGLLGSVAPAAASVPAFVAPWTSGVGGRAMAATAPRVATAETPPPPTYPRADDPTSDDAYTPAPPPHDQVRQTTIGGGRA